MSPSILLVLLAAVLTAVGVYLLLERSLSRIVIGLALLTNGVNVLYLVVSGAPGLAPINDGRDTAAMSDSFPQAMVLTAIVISLGMTAFLLAMAYRSWQLNGHDEVQDDLEDRRLARRAAQDTLDARVRDDDGATLADEARLAVDETGSLEAVD